MYQMRCAEVSSRSVCDCWSVFLSWSVDGTETCSLQTRLGSLSGTKATKPEFYLTFFLQQADVIRLQIPTLTDTVSVFAIVVFLLYKTTDTVPPYVSMALMSPNNKVKLK